MSIQNKTLKELELLLIDNDKYITVDKLKDYIPAYNYDGVIRMTVINQSGVPELWTHSGIYFTVPAGTKGFFDVQLDEGIEYVEGTSVEELAEKWLDTLDI